MHGALPLSLEGACLHARQLAIGSCGSDTSMLLWCRLTLNACTFLEYMCALVGRRAPGSWLEC
jgi:hypothetical protein